MPDDSRYTAAAIRPLVSHQRVQARRLILTFTCPVRRTHVQAQWAAPQSTGVASTVARHAKTSLMYEVQRQVLIGVRSMFGYGFAGQLATSVTSTAIHSASAAHVSGPPTLSAAEIDVGLVEAFRSVENQFVWASDRWVSKGAAPQIQDPMARQLEAAPVTSRYDQLLVARMMVEVASAHGGVGDAEEAHLSEAIPTELGSLANLASRPPLTRAELAEASPGPARQTMLAAVWALALCDEHEADAERALLEGYADALGVDGDQARDVARAFVIDQACDRAFAWGGHDRAAREELYAIGERIGMSRGEVERAEARYQKRKLG